MDNPRGFRWWWSTIMCTLGLVAGVVCVGALILVLAGQP